MTKIGWCESRNKAWAKNASSTASGRFQFLRSSWSYYGKKHWGDDLSRKNIFDWNDNTDLANYVFVLNGTSDWNESKYCWGS